MSTAICFMCWSRCEYSTVSQCGRRIYRLVLWDAARRGTYACAQVERVRAAVDDPDVAGSILEDAGSPVGHLLLRNVGRNWNISEIAQLVVTQPRKGYGRAAMEFAMHHIFKNLNAHRCYLDVVAHNIAAIRLYEGCGFTREATFRDGFPADDGTFCDLAGYGMLASEYFARSDARPRNHE